MNSLPHVKQFCSSCRYYIYYKWYEYVVFPRGSWYHEWAMNGVRLSTPYAKRSGCMGCAQVSMIHAQVLGMLLWKLGVKIVPDAD